MIRKIVGLRVFADEAGKMNLSINEAGGNLLVISQFTLHASYKKGNRPGFTAAAKPEIAIPLYEFVVSEHEARGEAADVESKEAFRFAGALSDLGMCYQNFFVSKPRSC